MANWIGAARTNYVRLAEGVTVEQLRHRLNTLGIQVSIWDDEHTKDGEQLVGFYPSDGDEGGFCSNFCPDDTAETRSLLGLPPEEEDDDDFPSDLEFSWEEHIMPFIRVGDVLVVLEAGHEKLCCITGVACAYIRREDGTVDSVTMQLDDIYSIARSAFGLPEDTPISNASY